MLPAQVRHRQRSDLFSASRICTVVLVESLEEPKGDPQNNPIPKNFHRLEKAVFVLRHIVDERPVTDRSDRFGLR